MTHWSTRLLAAELGISHVWVGKIWRRWGLQPWRAETFKFSTDPQLEAKVRDVVGLYLNPPEKAVVLCVDEKSQVQALDRTAPILPMQPGVSGEDRPTTTSATAPPPCSPRWRSPPARVEQACLHRGTATRSSCASSSRSPRPTRGGELHLVVRQLRHQLVEMPAGDQVCSHDLPGTDRVRSYATCRLCGLTLCGLASRSVLPAGVAQERFALPKVGLPSLAAIAEPPPRFGINRGGR